MQNNNVDSKRDVRVYSQKAVMRLLNIDEKGIRQLQQEGKLTPMQRAYYTGYTPEQVDKLIAEKKQ